MDTDWSALDLELKQSAADDSIYDYAVGAGIVTEKGLLIIIRALDEEFFPDYGEIPGGRVEKGESIIHALLRETTEETGLNIVTVQSYEGFFDFPTDQGFSVRQFNFLVAVDLSQIQLDPQEHHEYIWCLPNDRSKLDTVKITDEMKTTIHHLLDRIRS
ncbi:MAG: hypothetical protein JWM56_1195 [Candidatus Peribacteria bacterium]|nr:hypothetical protein [Candidatus Peribacteria bacterium]